MIRRGTPLRPSQRRRDPVTSDLRAYIIARDGFCVARKLSATGVCRDRWGNYPPGDNAWELDHVKDEPRMGVRAPSDRHHLVLLCNFHHQGGWATANRPLLRDYLREIEGVT